MANIEIRPQDRELFKLVKQDKVLTAIDINRLRASSGVTPIFCPDCDHSDDIWKHLQGILADGGKPNRIFPVSRAGGAIWIPKSDLLTKVGIPRDEDIFFDIQIGVDKKDITSLFPMAHSPCGAAAEYELSLFDQLELIVKAEARLKEKFAQVEHLEVEPLFHVCYSGTKRRTYHVSSANWMAHCEKYKEFDYTPNKLFSVAKA